MESRVIALACLILGWGGGCNESLPPRLQDPNSLVIVPTMNDGLCTLVDSVPSGAGEIRVQFENDYAEVLQDSVFIHVVCDAWLTDQPEVRARIEFGGEALEDPRIISGDFLTLVPHKLAIMDHQWSHRTAAGVGFWDYLRQVEKFDSRGNRYLETDSARMTMEGSVQIFKKLPAYRIPPSTITIVYQIR